MSSLAITVCVSIFTYFSYQQFMDHIVQLPVYYTDLDAVELSGTICCWNPTNRKISFVVFFCARNGVRGEK